LVFLLPFSFFSLKSPGPFFGCNRSEFQDSLAVILAALPPRFICSCPNFSAGAFFKQPCCLCYFAFKQLIKFLNVIFYSLFCSSFSFASFHSCLCF
jgi:hypothetical protein